jgi:hypothetical protein
MIEGLGALLEGSGHAGLPELRSALAELLGHPSVDGRLVAVDSLADAESVIRLSLEVDGETCTWIAKRHRPAPAHRNDLATRRWLPAVGLGGAAPRILATAADRKGRCVWHVYEDLGDRTLASSPERGALPAAVSLLASLHMSFEHHPLLAECREWGRDFGPAFYRTSVRDAITCLEPIPPARLNGSDGGLGLKHRLLERLWTLRDEEAERTTAIAELGGPDTFLHGDLWPKNVAVVDRGGKAGVRLLDWDRAGVGPSGYDVSTLVNRLPLEDRDLALTLYEDALAPAARRLPARPELDFLFVTFELARLASSVLWAALAVREDPRAEWALEELSLAPGWLGLETILAAG